MNKNPDPYEKLENTLAQFEPLTSLISYNPDQCSVMSNIPQKNIDRKCSHVIIGNMSGTMLFQIFMGSPYKSFFIYTDPEKAVHSQFEYKVRNVTLDNKTEIPASGTCVEDVLTPLPTMTCDIDTKGVSISVSFDTSVRKVIK